MGFALSPSVDVREFDYSVRTPNLPSAKTGMILRTDLGPCNKIVSITSEASLIETFGRPTASNFKDWFQAWNFLQYASSLYIVRPIPLDSTITETKNAGISLSWRSKTPIDASLWNETKAENELANLVLNGKLLVFNRNVTNVQDIAVAVCSTKSGFNKPIARVPYATPYVYPINSSVGGTIAGSVSWTALSDYGDIQPGDFYYTNGVYPTKVKILQVNTTSGGSKFIVGDQPATAAPAHTFNRFYIDVISSDTTSAVINRYNSKVTAGSLFYSPNSAGPTSEMFYVRSVGYHPTDSKKLVITYSTTAGSALESALPQPGIHSSNYWWLTATMNYESASGKDWVAFQGGSTFAGGGWGNYPAKINAPITIDGNVYTIIDVIGNRLYLDRPLTTDPDTDKAASLWADPFILKVQSGLNRFYDAGLITNNSGVESLVTFKNLFEFEPDFSEIANEIALVVLKKNTSGVWELKEKFIGSYDVAAKDFAGNSIYIDNLTFNGSKYIYTATYQGEDNSHKKADSADYPLITFTSTSANTYTSFTKADVQFAYDLFADAESFDINILLGHELDLNKASEIAATRKDCIAFISPCNHLPLVNNTADKVTDYLIDEFGAVTPKDDGSPKTFNVNNSYSAVYGNMKYQYDKFNDLNRWIPVMGDIAGLHAQTDKDRDPWWAAAGLERGKIKNTIKLAYNPKRAQRDGIYPESINPIMSIPGEGQGIVMGQKTSTSKPSAFDRVNVRRLLVTIEKSIATAARYSLFEFNDTFTRNRLKGIIEPFLRSVKARRGLYDYLLVIDDSNNGPDVVDQNALVIDIYLKPAKTAEFIQINAIVTSTGADFGEFITKK